MRPEPKIRVRRSYANDFGRYVVVKEFGSQAGFKYLGELGFSSTYHDYPDKEAAETALALAKIRGEVV